MHPLTLRFIITFVLILIINILRLISARIDFKSNVERPTAFQRFFLGVQAFLTVFTGLFSLLGFVMRDAEMAISFGVLTLIFSVILYFTRRKFKRYYVESEDFFWLKEQYAVNRIYYENITDWIPLRKQIGVLDETQLENRYVVVNLVFHDPEMLLKELAKMTFSGKFKPTDGSQPDDPNREQEFIDHLEKNGYGHIIEEFLEEKQYSDAL